MKKIVSFIFCSFFFLRYFFCADVIQIPIALPGRLPYYDSRLGFSFACEVTEQQLKDGCLIELISGRPNEVYLLDQTYHPLFLQVQPSKPSKNNQPISFKDEPVYGFINAVSFYFNISNVNMSGADKSTTVTQTFWPSGKSGCTVTSSQSNSTDKLTLTFTFPSFQIIPNNIHRTWRMK